MRFGDTRIDEAEGAILAHALATDDLRFKKGRCLSAEDVAALSAAGIESVIAARLEPGDVHEDAAADAIAAALCGPGLKASAAFTGRCNLLAEARGVLTVERTRLDDLNLVDEAVTVATLPPYAAVEMRQMAATIKIIPFAVGQAVLERCLAIAGQDGPLLRVAAFAPRRVGLVQTRLPSLKESLLEKTVDAVNARLAALDCPPVLEARCAHRTDEVAGAIAALRAQGAEIMLVSGASAIVDRRDVVPAGIVAAGGEIDHFGMPVDPGNLMLLGHLEDSPMIGLPGCARSPKLNGFDWVLQRLVAGLAVTPRDVMLMGGGGLLKESAARPLPRAQAVERADEDLSAPLETASEKAAHAPRIAAVVLAAGRSTRMGGVNKLLADVEGRAMIDRVVESVLVSQTEPVVVVTGHERARVEAALAPHVSSGRVRLVHNPDFAAGLSTSLHRGLAALPEEADGAVVCLGDMPGITASVIDRLVAAFDPLEGRAICLPTWRGKRGNPVLLARRFFAEMQTIAGDVGARALIGEYPEAVCEVAMEALAGGEAVLSDVDTPEALAALKSAG
ncbi:MAG: molybdopterin-binding/glycosyltransferase family 2 protein [Kiloniellales bacterium]|jgi:molybdenum cofactor cytidylyltransferase